jgi:dihydrofolate reductase
VKRWRSAEPCPVLQALVRPLSEIARCGANKQNGWSPEDAVPSGGAAMRKLIVSSFVSLDGVVEAPMSWIGNYFDDECKDYAYNKLMDVEVFLLGRVTYEMFSAVWPHVKGDRYIDRINGLKKLVASRTLKEVTWNASLIAGDAASEIRKIKEQPGAHIMKYGVSELDRTLVANHLVDEYHLSIVPTRVGRGKRAFEDVDGSLLNLQCVDTHRFSNGVVVLNYVPR